MDTQTILNIAFIILGFALIALIAWLVSLIRTQHTELIDLARDYMSKVRDLAPDFVVKELADMARGGLATADAKALDYVTRTPSKIDDELYVEMRKEMIRLFNELKNGAGLPTQGMDDAVLKMQRQPNDDIAVRHDSMDQTFGDTPTRDDNV